MDSAQADSSQYSNQSRRNHWHVYQNNISFLYALFPQHAGQCRDFLLQLGIADLLLVARDWTVPDDGCGVAIARFHVSVDAIVRCADFSFGEPRPAFMR